MELENLQEKQENKAVADDMTTTTSICRSLIGRASVVLLLLLLLHTSVRVFSGRILPYVQRRNRRQVRYCYTGTKYFSGKAVHGS